MLVVNSGSDLKESDVRRIATEVVNGRLSGLQVQIVMDSGLRQQIKDLVGSNVNKQLPTLVRKEVATTLLTHEGLNDVFSAHRTSLIATAEVQLRSFQEECGRVHADTLANLDRQADRLVEKIARTEEGSMIVRTVTKQVEANFTARMLLGFVLSAVVGAFGGYFFSQQNNK